MLSKWLRPGVASVCLLLAACGAGTRADVSADRETPQPATALLSPAEALAQSRREPRSTDTPLFKSGDAYAPALPHNLCTAQPDGSLLLDPAFMPGSGPGELAYAMYRFDVSGYGGALDFSAAWSEGPFDDNSVFFGVGNFIQNRWDWFESAGGPAVPDKAAHTAGDGSVLVAIVVTGNSNPRLSSLALGNAVPQVEIISTGPLEGPPGLILELDGSGSSDPDGSIADYAWDPEGDGSYLPHLGPGSPFLSHVYCTLGTYHPTLRLTDDQGATATASLTVAVKLGSPVEVTIGNTGGGNVEGICLRNVGALPAVAYNSGTSIYYARATSPDYKTWSLPSELTDYMGYSAFDLEIVGGRPALAFQTFEQTLGCFWSNDAAGTDWPAYATAVPYDDSMPGFYPSLAEGNNQPAIVYGDGYGDIWLVRATASDLSAWSSPKALTNQAEFCAGPSFGWVGGLPALTCMTVEGLSDAGRMLFVRANEAWDVSWQAPLAPLASGAHILNGASLLEAGGLPAILYWDDLAGRLKWLRANDEDGSSWKPPQELPPTFAVSSQGFSLGLVNGLPCAAYASKLDEPGCGMWIVYATDPAASAWGEPILLKSGAFTRFLALADINGRPGVAWLEDATHKVRFKSYLP